MGNLRKQFISKGIGWGSIKDIVAYTGYKERKIRDLIKEGLPYSQIGENAKILVRFSDVDEFLLQYRYEHDSAQTLGIVNKLLEEVNAS